MPLIAMGAGIAARTRGPHWMLAPDEISGLSAALAGVLVYLPLPEKELGVTVAIGQLAMVCVGIAMPRIALDMELREMAQRQAAISTAEQVMADARAKQGPAPEPQFGFGE